MIAVENLAVRAGAFRLDGVSFTISAGEYVALMGKTGSGKTTLLEAVCGLKPLQTGRVLLLGRDVTRLKPAGRGVGYVPQDLALFSTLNVRDHLAFALEVRGWGRAETAARVEELSELLGLRGLLDRRPAGLSGGEAQRVALGRALAFRPPVLLLDEPLSALDDETRAEMYTLLRSVRRRTGVTTLHVTHSLAEAKALADRILFIKGGAVMERPGGDGQGERAVKVTVRYMAQLRQAAGAASEPVEVDRPCTAAELLNRLAARHGRPFRDLVLDAAGGVRPAVLLFVGDEQVRPEATDLRDGDVLTVLTPMAGG